MVLGILFPPQMAFAVLCFQDLDNDGFGTGSSFENGEAVCVVNQSSFPGDCDDGNLNVSPAAPELIGDNIDQNCDGVDSCYFDADGDSFGSNVVVTDNNLDCSDASFPSTSVNNLDCNDAAVAISPGAPELIGDSIDQNCNLVDSCYLDADGDSFGVNVVVEDNNLDCSDASAPNTSVNNLDCNDANPLETLICEIMAVGGTFLPIDTTALLLAGVQSISMWMIFGVLSAVGIGLAVFTLKRSR